MSQSLNLNDDFFKKMNTSEEYQINRDQMNDFWITLKQQTMQQVVQEFGIQELLNKIGIGTWSKYKDGGDFSTIHNAKNGVFVDENHERRFNKSFNRKDYEGRKYKDKKGNVINNTLSSQRKELFKNNEHIYDAYTGKEIPKNGHTNMDHITSAKAIHDNDEARLYMSDNARNDMAVDKSNMAPIEERMNKSKGEHQLKEWEQKTASGLDVNNKERYGVKDELAHPKVEKSEKQIKRTIRAAKTKEFSGAALKSGVVQAKRQIGGVLVYLVTDIVINELKKMGSRWSSFSNNFERLEALKVCVKSIKLQVIEQFKDVKTVLKELLGAVVTGFTSGLVGTIVSAITNTFVTVVSKWGKVLQDGISSFIQGFKLLVTNPQHLDKKQLFKSVIKVISLGLAAIVGTFVGESVRAALMATPLAFLADSLAILSGALVSGVLSALIIYSIDNFGHIIQEFKNAWDDIKYGLTVSKKMILDTYDKALMKIDEAYRELLTDIQQQYTRLKQLGKLAHDINQLASSQLGASVNYALVSGVPEEKVLHNRAEISKYFME